MEPPNKRLRQSPPEDAGQDDFISFGGDEDGEEERAQQFGYNDNTNGAQDVDISSAPRGPRAMYTNHNRNVLNDARHGKDRPKSKHILPGHEPWVLVKTKFKRRFVHNVSTGESLWRIPADLMSTVLELEAQERLSKEKKANAKWAEAQLEDMRSQAQASGSNTVPVDADARARRRRSESLQREDEQAMLAEIAAEAERAEEEDVKEVVREVERLKPTGVQHDDAGDGSDSSYEEVEVTDSEGEEEDVESAQRGQQANGIAGPEASQDDDGPVEFGEDDIAYQLAAMEQDYDDVSNGDGSAGDEYVDDNQDEAEPEPDNDEESAQVFREMLTDHNISPFTPWEKIISNDSLILDDRWLVPPNMRTRKSIWEGWVRDTAAQLKAQRAEAEKVNPKVPYLEFLSEHASTKLYWPEFKRKYRKEDVMNGRGLSDKERESLYRDLVRRLKLPESTRKADLLNMMKSLPLSELNANTNMETLPQSLTGKVEFWSLKPEVRNAVVMKHIAGLPAAPTTNSTDTNDRQADATQRKREEAMKERERQVDEQRRKAEKEERWAKKDLREEERRLGEAMVVGRGGLTGQLRDG